MPRKLYTWKLKDREIRLGERTLIVAILNITPDSFSDGGRYEDPDRAYARALEMEELGADIIDIGAESTRPGSSRISAAEELRRLIPVLKPTRLKSPRAPSNMALKSLTIRAASPSIRCLQKSLSITTPA